MKKNLFFVFLLTNSIILNAQGLVTMKGIPASLTDTEEKKLSSIFKEYHVYEFSESHIKELKESKQLRFDLKGADFPDNSFQFENYELFNKLNVRSKEISSFLETSSFMKGIKLKTGEYFSLSIINSSISGLFHNESGEDYQFIPMSYILGKDFSSNKIVFFKSSSYKSETPYTCGTNSILNKVNRNAKVMWGSDTYCRVVNVAIEGDYEWLSWYGYSTGLSTMASIMSNVASLYSAQLGFVVQVSNTYLWAFSGDPYSNGPIAKNTALSEVVSYWNTYNSSISRDCAILFSKRGFTGSDIGVANENSMCTSNAYGMIANPLYDYQTVAHELGHILGAGHVGATTPSTLMQTNITGTTTFASSSISEIRTDLTGGLESCLNTGEINVNKDGSPVNPYDTNYGCLYTWYSMNSSGPGVQSITWTVQNYSAGAYVVTSNSSSATISAGSTAGDFVVKASKTNACGTIDRYYPFEVSSCFRFSVYPNPTTDILFIEFESSEEIKNLNGKLELFSENSSVPVISVIPSELYTAKAISNNKIELDVKNLNRGI